MRRKFDVYPGSGRATTSTAASTEAARRAATAGIRSTSRRPCAIQPHCQSWIGLKTSSSNVSSSASAWCGTPDGMCSTSPSRTVISSPPTTTFSAPLQDVGHLLALVRVHRHERAALQINLREHLALAGDDLLRDHLGDFFERDLVPAMERARQSGSMPRSPDSAIICDAYEGFDPGATRRAGASGGRAEANTRD